MEVLQKQMWAKERRSKSPVLHILPHQDLLQRYLIEMTHIGVGNGQVTRGHFHSKNPPRNGKWVGSRRNEVLIQRTPWNLEMARFWEEQGPFPFKELTLE